MNTLSHARRILAAIDHRLDRIVELTLYGRAALHLGFPDAPPEIAQSVDVDAVLWVGQAQQLADDSNFWEAIEGTNRELAEAGLYASHFFEETQVIVRPCWREARTRLPEEWEHLRLWRLGDLDLLLSKLMRNDAQDLRDALFIARAAKLETGAILAAFAQARVPNIAELEEQFALCKSKFLRQAPDFLKPGSELAR